MSGDKYLRLDKVGHGTYGEVFKGKDRRTGAMVALKRIKPSHSDEGIPGTALREISLLTELSEHPNIVKLHEAYYHRKELYLAFEWMDKDLKKYMDACRGPLSGSQVKSFMYQMLQAIAACHARGVMHRDLKPQNVLVNKAGELKLADFGLARSYIVPLRRYTHEVITLWYRAPEVLLGQRVYTPAVDMWSAGAMFAEMYNKKALWRGDSEIDQLFRVFRSLGTPNETVWPGIHALPDFQPAFPKWRTAGFKKLCPTIDPKGLDLLQRMLAYDPTKRISAEDALAHPYFEGVHVPGAASTTSKPGGGRSH